MDHSSLRQDDILWAARRLPKSLRHLMLEVGPKLVVAGGYLRACIAGEPVNDVDCFAPTRELAKEWAEKISKKPYESDNAFTCTGRHMTVQFIHRWTYDKPEDILKSFDFTIAMAALWFDPQYLEPSLVESAWNVPQKKFIGISHPDFYSDLAAKRLVYTSPERNEDAGGSILRVLKFYQRGYRIPLDSFGAVMARLVRALEIPKLVDADGQHVNEKQAAKVLTGLLREVDPNLDPAHLYHLPTKEEQEAVGMDLTRAEAEDGTEEAHA